jgi:hypothetical protein
MEMDTLIITAADIENGRIKDESRVADVKGHIRLEANLGIVFARCFHAAGKIFAGAGTGIEAGEGIKAGWGIKAGTGISCKAGLTAAFRIFAGIAIWLKVPTPEQRRITCGRLTSGEVCYGDLTETSKQTQTTESAPADQVSQPTT